MTCATPSAAWRSGGSTWRGEGDDGPRVADYDERYLHSKPRPGDSAKLTEIFAEEGWEAEGRGTA